jgi:SAM-dependent methyltransferase
LLPGGASVLDLGSGPGHHAAYIQSEGCEVLCVDLSPEMIAKCEEQGLEAVVGDIENLDLGERRFDSIWMHTSLLHVPRQYIPGVVASLCNYLEPGGVLGLTVWEGTGEGPREQDAEKYAAKRWYTYFTDDDIRQLFGTHFVVGALQRRRIGADKVMLSYYMTSRVHT